jgi:hypothetical protein
MFATIALDFIELAAQPIILICAAVFAVSLVSFLFATSSAHDRSIPRRRYAVIGAITVPCFLAWFTYRHGPADFASLHSESFERVVASGELDAPIERVQVLLVLYAEDRPSSPAALVERLIPATIGSQRIVSLPELDLELALVHPSAIGMQNAPPGIPIFQVRGSLRDQNYSVNESPIYSRELDVGDARPLLRGSSSLRLEVPLTLRASSRPRAHVFWRVIRAGDLVERIPSDEMLDRLHLAGQIQFRAGSGSHRYEPSPLRPAGRLLIEANLLLASWFAVALLLLGCAIRGPLAVPAAPVAFLAILSLDARLDHAATRAALDSPDPATRGRAAGRLADFAAFAGPAAEALEARFAIEADPEVRAAIAIAAADPQTIVGTLEPARRVVAAARADRDERVRGVVAGAED